MLLRGSCTVVVCVAGWVGEIAVDYEWVFSV